MIWAVGEMCWAVGERSDAVSAAERSPPAIHRATFDLKTAKVRAEELGRTAIGTPEQPFTNQEDSRRVVLFKVRNILNFHEKLTFKTYATRLPPRLRSGHRGRMVFPGPGP